MTEKNNLKGNNLPEKNLKEKNKIINRIYLKGTLCLDSPAIIASGIDDNSDIDILRDYKGDPYIPGSTLAGLLRNLCADGIEFENEETDIGVSFGKPVLNQKEDEKKNKDNYSTLSSLIIYDAQCSKKGTVSLRDGVRLGQYKTAEHEGKLDYEIVDCGTEFCFRLEAVVRRGQLADIEKNISRIVYGLQKRLVRIGMKTRRGFGKIHLKDVRYLKLDMSKETLDSWINFNWDQVKNVYTTKEKFDRGDKYTTITVALNIPYTLLIRSYLIHHDGEKPRTTAEQLTRIGADGLNKEDVIPGTSWAGAFRAHIEDLYRQEILPGLEIDNVFGCIGTKDNSKRSQASAICFEESIVKDGKRVKQVRTAIDRFLGGASKGALYANCPLLNTDGKASTELIIRVLNKSGENDYIVGLMLLCIDELARGMLSVGGETAIGRGIFTVKGVSPDENEKISELVNKNILITGNIGNTVDNEDTGNTGNVGDIPGKTAAYYRKALVEKIKQFQEMAVV